MVVAVGGGGCVAVAVGGLVAVGMAVFVGGEVAVRVGEGIAVEVAPGAPPGGWEGAVPEEGGRTAASANWVPVAVAVGSVVTAEMPGACVAAPSAPPVHGQTPEMAAIAPVAPQKSSAAPSRAQIRRSGFLRARATVRAGLDEGGSRRAVRRWASPP